MDIGGRERESDVDRERGVWRGRDQDSRERGMREMWRGLERGRERE